MNITSGILLNLKKLKLKEISNEENYKIEFNAKDTKSLKLNIYEYNL